MANPRLEVARLRLAAQQGQQHPLASLTQGFGQGLQFGQNLLAKKQEMAESRARLRLAQEQQKQQEEQFKLQTEFQREAEKRAKAEEGRRAAQEETRLEGIPQAQREAQARLDSIMQQMQISRESGARSQAGFEDSGQVVRDFHRQQNQPPLPPQGAQFGPGGVGATPVAPGENPPAFAGPQPQTGAGAQTLSALQAPGLAAQAGERDFQRKRQLSAEDWIMRIKLEASKIARSGGPSEKIALEAAKAAIKSIMEFKQLQRYRTRPGETPPGLEFTEEDFKAIKSAMMGGVQGLQGLGIGGGGAPPGGGAPGGSTAFPPSGGALRGPQTPTLDDRLGQYRR